MNQKKLVNDLLAQLKDISKKIETCDYHSTDISDALDNRERLINLLTDLQGKVDFTSPEIEKQLDEILLLNSKILKDLRKITTETRQELMAVKKTKANVNKYNLSNTKA